MTAEYKRVLAAAEAGTDADEELPPFPATLLLAALDAAAKVPRCSPIGRRRPKPETYS